MAVLRLRDEADCLSSQRTKRSLRTHLLAYYGPKPPYRASGLVLRPTGDSQRRVEQSSAPSERTFESMTSA